MPIFQQPALLVYVLIGANNDLRLLASIILFNAMTNQLNATVKDDFFLRRVTPRCSLRSSWVPSG